MNIHPQHIASAMATFNRPCVLIVTTEHGHNILKTFETVQQTWDWFVDNFERSYSPVRAKEVYSFDARTYDTIIDEALTASIIDEGILPHETNI